MRKVEHNWVSKLTQVLSLLVLTGLLSYTIFSLTDNNLLSEYKDLRTNSSETIVDLEEEDSENDPSHNNYTGILINYTGFIFNEKNWYLIYTLVKPRPAQNSFKLSLFILNKVIRL